MGNRLEEDEDFVVCVSDVSGVIKHDPLLATRTLARSCFKLTFLKYFLSQHEK